MLIGNSLISYKCFSVAHIVGYSMSRIYLILSKFPALLSESEDLGVVGKMVS